MPQYPKDQLKRQVPIAFGDHEVFGDVIEHVIAKPPGSFNRLQRGGSDFSRTPGTTSRRCRWFGGGCRLSRSHLYALGIMWSVWPNRQPFQWPQPSWWGQLCLALQCHRRFHDQQTVSYTHLTLPTI